MSVRAYVYANDARWAAERYRAVSGDHSAPHYVPATRQYGPGCALWVLVPDVGVSVGILVYQNLTAALQQSTGAQNAVLVSTYVDLEMVHLDDFVAVLEDHGYTWDPTYWDPINAAPPIQKGTT